MQLSSVKKTLWSRTCQASSLKILGLRGQLKGSATVLNNVNGRFEEGFSNSNFVQCVSTELQHSGPTSMRGTSMRGQPSFDGRSCKWSNEVSSTESIRPAIPSSQAWRASSAIFWCVAKTRSYGWECFSACDTIQQDDLGLKQPKRPASAD